MAIIITSGNSKGSRRSSLKADYQKNVAQEEFSAIVAEQDAAIEKYGLNKTGLLKSHAKRHFSVSVAGAGVVGTMGILAYMRFLDMKELKDMNRRRQYHLYNKIVYGHIYGSMFRKLAFGYTEEVKAKIIADYKI